MVDRRPPSADASPRLLIYSHDTVGMGNVRRTLLLARALTSECPRGSVLIVTGSPFIHDFRLPERVDYVKLPCVDRTAPEVYRARALALHTVEVKRLRREMLAAVFRGFDPDLVIVDKRPAGLDDELQVPLEALRRRGRARVVLGLRDVLDEPHRTRNLLAHSGGFDAIEELYDEVWIFGSANVFDPTKEYEFPDSVVRKTRFCGYLAPRVRRSPRRIGCPGVLVTVGGGQDGAALVETSLEAMSRGTLPASLRAEVLMGPQMPERARARLRARYGRLAGVSLRDFAPDMSDLYASADVVVSMAGYGTVCELLSHRRRAVLVPRAEPVREQLVRARRLAALGLFAMVEPDDLTSLTLVERLLHELGTTPRTPDPVDLGGLVRVRQRTRDLLRTRTA